MTKKKIAAIAASGLIIVGAATHDDSKPKTATHTPPAMPTVTPHAQAPSPTPTPVPLSAKLRYKRHKFYCSDGRAFVGDDSLLTSDKKSTVPGDRRFCATDMQARYDDDQFACFETDTSLTRKEKRFCAKKIHGWHWTGEPKPVKPSDDCSDKASALALAALLSGHPITAVQAAQLAADTAGTGEKCP